MQGNAVPDHREPTRVEALAFFLKTRVFIARRLLRDLQAPVGKHPPGSVPADAPVIAEERSPLWTQASPAELPLTAGKIQNLRVACSALNGVSVPAGAVFGFWRQMGRVTKRKGYVTGRELRSGCMVPSLGGGLCQVSGLLHAAALKAGLEVLERHTHSMSLPGAPIPPERDATVFWNYVDLRFRAPFPWQLHVSMTERDLVVTIRADRASEKTQAADAVKFGGSPMRAKAEGDCLTCGVTSCFRHPSAIAAHAHSAGHTAWLLDGRWPEFDAWCGLHAREGDRWFTPLDGARFGKANYAWSLPQGAWRRHATVGTLIRSFRQRRIPAQGAVRQRFMLAAQRRLAERFAAEVDPMARHLVVSQSLLPHLWKTGCLGGRTFDVLANRWPLAELQERLDRAALAHPSSETIRDFRADAALLHAETEAFAAAARIVTPHRGIARHFGAKALLLDWSMPPPITVGSAQGEGHKWFFPASALARKGIYELAEALRGSGDELWVLGGAKESGADPLAGIRHRRAALSELGGCTTLVMPAWIEHEPRLALLALASGIPVIATDACGLPGHPLLTPVPEGDAAALKIALARHRQTDIHLPQTTA
jgi:glycosyltransferase involved in cell wall biosynthesis